MKLIAHILLLHAVSAALLKPEGAPAPAAAEAKKSKGKVVKSIDALKIKFEIRNFNYYDLTKETCPEKTTKKVPVAKEAPKAKAKAKVAAKSKVQDAAPKLPDAPEALEAPEPEIVEPDVKGAIAEVHGHADGIAKAVGGVSKFGKKEDAPPKPPWMEEKKGEKKKQGEVSLLQLNLSEECPLPEDLGETETTECTTIADVLRTAIKETVLSVIRCLYMQSLSPGPAPAPGPMLLPAPQGIVLPGAAPGAGAPAGFLQVPAPSPAPAPTPSGPPQPRVQVFVTFLPGPSSTPLGRSTMVEISFLDTPDNGVDDVGLAKPFLVWCKKNGFLGERLGDALEQVTKVPPKIKGMTMGKAAIEQWNIEKCEKHITSIVNEFSHHYTRRQVPLALYNECTNFMTMMSFSHDYVLDHRDTARCRRATKKLAEHWKHGKNAEDKDFEEMCFHACEAKYGLNAPQCNVEAGDKLHKQPLL